MVGRPVFHVEIAQDLTATRVTVSGDIDIATVGHLERARAEALAAAPTRVLIDLREVEFVDSSGIRFLLETGALSKEGGWTLRVIKPASSAMRAFVVTGADRFLPLVDDDG
jgi:anti-sigma B factor antagonist